MEQNYCQTKTCGPNSICKVKDSQELYGIKIKISCVCNPGFKFTNISENECEDINECEIENICPANSMCKNLEGSFYCECEVG